MHVFGNQVRSWSQETTGCTTRWLCWRSTRWERQAAAEERLLLRRRVMWLVLCDLHERKPRCIQENNQGNTGRAQKNANIFIVLNKNPHPYTHTYIYTHAYMSQMPPHHQPNPSLTPIATRLYTHTYITQEKKKEKLPAPWQNSPQVHLHKTLSLTKWLHLTSWVGGRTLPVAASYLRIPQSFSRQATVSWPPL